MQEKILDQTTQYVGELMRKQYPHAFREIRPASASNVMDLHEVMGFTADRSEIRAGAKRPLPRNFDTNSPKMGPKKSKKNI